MNELSDFQKGQFLGTKIVAELMIKLSYDIRLQIFKHSKTKLELVVCSVTPDAICDR